MAKVFIGVGHGGIDSGAVGYLVEKEVNLVEALACRDFLEAHGVEVLMSRTTDENDPVTDEINECNALDLRLFTTTKADSAKIWQKISNPKS